MIIVSVRSLNILLSTIQGSMKETQIKYKDSHFIRKVIIYSYIIYIIMANLSIISFGLAVFHFITILVMSISIGWHQILWWESHIGWGHFTRLLEWIGWLCLHCLLIIGLMVCVSIVLLAEGWLATAVFVHYLCTCLLCLYWLIVIMFCLVVSPLLAWVFLIF